MTSNPFAVRYSFQGICEGGVHDETIGRSNKKAIACRLELLAGKRPVEVVEKVGVARQTVYTW